jgi:hypothetical protein
VKVLDVAGTGIKAAVAAAQKLVAPAAAVRSRDAEEELRRRASVNAEAARRRAEREAELFGTGAWVPRRSGWLGGR